MAYWRHSYFLHAKEEEESEEGEGEEVSVQCFLKNRPGPKKKKPQVPNSKLIPLVILSSSISIIVNPIQEVYVK